MRSLLFSAAAGLFALGLCGTADAQGKGGGRGHQGQRQGNGGNQAAAKQVYRNSFAPAYNNPYQAAYRNGGFPNNRQFTNSWYGNNRYGSNFSGNNWSRYLGNSGFGSPFGYGLGGNNFYGNNWSRYLGNSGFGSPFGYGFGGNNFYGNNWSRYLGNGGFGNPFGYGFGGNYGSNGFGNIFGNLLWQVVADRLGLPTYGFGQGFGMGGGYGGPGNQFGYGGYGYGSGYGGYGGYYDGYDYDDSYISYNSGAAATSPDQATVHVILPHPHAQLSVQGEVRPGAGVQRDVVSPPLERGYEYTYTVQAIWTQHGRPVTVTRRVPVFAGRVSVADFTRPESVAQR